MADSAARHPVADGLGHRVFQTVVAPPGPGPGFWAGAPSAVWHAGEVWLAYRLRRPVDAGRGYANVIAWSADGYSFRTVAGVTSSQFRAASLERPALVVAPDGTWRLFVSCSTEGSKHWWIEVLEATSPERLGAQGGRMVLPGDLTTAWKDPVVALGDHGWRMWPCRHDITVADDADRMESWYATSTDGERWDLAGPALQPTPGTWDQRGARITAVVKGIDGSGRWLAFYDGRASAEENWQERTGLALSAPGQPGRESSPDRFEAVAPGPLVSAPSIRYVSPVALPDGSWLVYYEAQREDGAHELRVERVDPATPATKATP